LLFDHTSFQMLGSKSKGLFIDLVGDTILAARTTGTSPEFTIEELREFPLTDADDVASAIRAFAGVRGAGYASARCAIYPPNRLVARLAVDGRKLREESYLAEHVKETLKIDPEHYNLFTLSPTDGADTASVKSSPKDILVCGAPAEELVTCQNRLLDLGVFPDRMELGTVAAIGGAINYLAFTDSKSPTLMLEIGNETTNVFVLSRDGVEISRAVAFGISSMIPLVQKELGLKDEESARKLFFSNSFDFTSMGPQLTKKLLRELQASIGFYEVQTGQSIAQLFCTLLPSKVAWLQGTLGDVLGMRVLSIKYVSWLKTMGIEISSAVKIDELGPMWTGLFCLMGEYKGRQDEAAA
jgi:hypothetical protein